MIQRAIALDIRDIYTLIGALRRDNHLSEPHKDLIEKLEKALYEVKL